jgi:uncharacterized membrane protein
VAGVVTVPVDPAAEPTLAFRIAAALARQAGMGVEIVAVPPVGLSAEAYLAARVQEDIEGGAPRAHGRLLVAYARRAP